MTCPKKVPSVVVNPYQDYLRARDEFGFREISNIDITDYVAPGFDLEADAIENFFRPLIDVFNRILAIKKSLLIRSGLFLYRKKLQKLKHRYLDNKDRNCASFRKYKSYRFILLQVSD